MVAFVYVKGERRKRVAPKTGAGLGRPRAGMSCHSCLDVSIRSAVLILIPFFNRLPYRCILDY